MGATEFIPLKIAIVSVSDTRDLDSDTSGQLAMSLLEGVGHEIASRTVVTDNRETIRTTVAGHIADASVDIVITIGGTGVTPRDVTPEAIEPLVSKAIPGFGELFRWLSFEEIGTSTVQSRAMAALCDTTYVFVLPGSRGAVRCALERILISQLDHRHRPCNFVELLPRIRSEREDVPGK